MTIVVHNLFQYPPLKKKLTFFKKNNPERRKNIGTYGRIKPGDVFRHAHMNHYYKQNADAFCQVDEFYSTFGFDGSFSVTHDTWYLISIPQDFDRF